MRKHNSVSGRPHSYSLSPYFFMKDKSLCLNGSGLEKVVSDIENNHSRVHLSVDDNLRISYDFLGNIWFHIKEFGTVSEVNLPFKHSFIHIEGDIKIIVLYSSVLDKHKIFTEGSLTNLTIKSSYFPYGIYYPFPNGSFFDTEIHTIDLGIIVNGLSKTYTLLGASTYSYTESGFYYKVGDGKWNKQLSLDFKVSVTTAEELIYYPYIIVNGIERRGEIRSNKNQVSYLYLDTDSVLIDDEISVKVSTNESWEIK